jgi:3-oxoacyl-[acyl-carrier protein] reductase
MKTVLITGSSRGIGAAAAQCFWEAGYNVVLNGRSGERLQQMEKKLNDLRPGSALAVRADITRRDEVEQLFDRAIDRFGKVDVLINNAAVALIKLFTDVTDAEWDAVFDTSVKGAFYCAQRAAKEMVRRHEGGVILNLSSMWGQVGASCEVPYSAAKGALIAFTKALAKELGPSDIRVNCVAPGVIMTDMNRELDEETLEGLKEETPLMRLGRPEEIGRLLLFLASDDASFITGQVIGANGGMVV